MDGQVQTEKWILKTLEQMLKPLPTYYHKLQEIVVYEVFKNFGHDVYGWKITDDGWQFRLKKSRVKQWFGCENLIGRHYKIVQNGFKVRVTRVKNV